MGCDDGHCDLVAGATNIMVHAWARPKGIRASCSGMGGATEARRYRIKWKANFGAHVYTTS